MKLFAQHFIQKMHYIEYEYHLQYKQCTWWAFTRASQYLGKEYRGTGKSLEWKDAFADLQKKLPDGVRLKCCLTCRHGTLCPYGNIPNYVLCSKPETITSKDDVITWLYEVDDIEPMERNSFQSCEHFIFADEEHFTYNDFLYYLRNKTI